MWRFLFILSILLFLAAVLIFRPVPIISEDEALVAQGVVVAIGEGGPGDVVFRLEGEDRRFYINRGLDNGLKLDSLRQQLLGNKVTLKYPKYWTPLDWNGRIRHLSKVQVGDSVIYSELK